MAELSSSPEQLVYCQLRSQQESQHLPDAWEHVPSVHTSLISMKRDYVCPFQVFSAETKNISTQIGDRKLSHPPSTSVMFRGQTRPNAWVTSCCQYRMRCQSKPFIKISATSEKQIALLSCQSETQLTWQTPKTQTHTHKRQRFEGRPSLDMLPPWCPQIHIA